MTSSLNLKRKLRLSDATTRTKRSSEEEKIEQTDGGTTESERASEEEQEGVTLYPNRWARIRPTLRECAAEFIGTMILVILGNGVDCQVVLSGNTAVAPSQKGSYLSISIGWGCGTALGVWFAGGVSGGHINPAVTLALATWRDFPWRKVPKYIISQLLGALIGAFIVYANYFHAIDQFEGKGVRTQATASLFSPYALDYMTNVSCFFSEFMTTAILMLVVCSITDKRNGPPPAGLNPLVLFICVTGLGAGLGMETSYGINPARATGPLLMTSMVGYGSAVFTFRNQYWLWCEVLAPILGAQVAIFVYDAFIFEGEQSLLNRPDARARRRHLHAPPDEARQPIAGPDAV